ncbi:MAG: S8 family serine peptidase, partial [archaeon]|nr:S8 family serine peptidase [archaeon]
MKAYFVALLLLSSIGISFVDTSSNIEASQLSFSESIIDTSECGHSTFSKNVKSSFRRESDLRDYSNSQIYLTKEWVVVLNNPYCNHSITNILDDKDVVGYEEFNILNGTWIIEFQSGELAKNLLHKFQSSGKIWSFYPIIEKQFSNKYEPNDHYYQSGDQWYLDNNGLNNGTIGVDINVETTWNEFTGDGVVIGIIDDGIDYSHPDISPNFLASNSYDYCGDDNDVMPSDSNGDGEIDWHGTAVSGIAGAKGNNDIGIAGVAYNSSIVGIRLLGGDCSRTDSLEAASLSHSLDLVDIYVNSWGPIDDGDVLEGMDPLTLAAIETGISQGRDNFGSIYVWANGNGLANRDNSNKDGYANSRYTIAVGAIDWKGEQTTYSEPGSNLLVSAPSNGQDLDNLANIITTDIVGSEGHNLTNYTFTMEGTSSAAPMVSGVIALMLEANPNLTWRDVQHILVQTSRKVDSDHIGWFQTEVGNWYNHAYGYGLVDAAASVSLAKTWTTIGNEISLSTGKIEVNKNILDNNNEGITSNISIDQGINIESVEILVNITHSTRGDLNLFLESPNGIVSELVRENNQDLGDHYHDWTFTSVVHWGENTFGEWKIKVNDTVSGGASDRIFNNWTMTMYGTLDLDNDEDGLPNYIDSKLGTGINNPDFDGDGLLDGAEFYGWNDRNGNPHKTDPKHLDSDRDGLRDMYEGFNGTYVTDPNNNDTDGDGIYDGEEVNEYFTNPTSTDTDNDTIGDYQEINAFDLGSKYSDPTKVDSDNDTMPDPYELANGFDPMIKSDGSDDADMDGFDSDNSGWPPSADEYFTNAMEYLAGTNPNDPDSDDDGMPDGWEFYWGLDPLTDDSNEDFDNDSLSNILEYDNRRIENTIFSYSEPFVKGYWKFDGTDSTSASNMVPGSDIAIVLNGAGREPAKFKKGINCDGIDDGVR